MYTCMNVCMYILSLCMYMMYICSCCQHRSSYPGSVHTYKRSELPGAPSSDRRLDKHDALLPGGAPPPSISPSEQRGVSGRRIDPGQDRGQGVLLWKHVVGHRDLSRPTATARLGRFEVRRRALIAEQ